LVGHIAYTAYNDNDSRMESRRQVCAGPRRPKRVDNGNDIDAMSFAPAECRPEHAVETLSYPSNNCAITAQTRLPIMIHSACFIDDQNRVQTIQDAATLPTLTVPQRVEPLAHHSHHLPYLEEDNILSFHRLSRQILSESPRHQLKRPKRQVPVLRAFELCPYPLALPPGKRLHTIQQAPSQPPTSIPWKEVHRSAEWTT
jgi:hypothetical protein